MAGLEIENQGRHDGEGFRELADDLWSNKPLLIVLAVGLFLVVYLIAKNRKSAISAPGSSTPSNPAGSQGNYLAVFDVEPPNVAVTVNNPNPTTQQTPTPPPGGNPCKPGWHFVSERIPLGMLLTAGSYRVSGGVCVPDKTPGKPPTGIFPPSGNPTPPPTNTPPPPPPPPKGTPRTVTVTKWPSQDSTLWGIAQHYHVNEQALYNLNKAKIGNNPNLIHPGLVLTLPS